MSDNKFKKTASITTYTERDIYGCDSCKINNRVDADRTCPCPRGSCEAKVIGREKMTTKFYKVNP